LADEKKADEILSFFKPIFKSLRKAAVNLPPRIKEGIENGWTVVIKLNPSKEVIGTIILAHSVHVHFIMKKEEAHEPHIPHLLIFSVLHPEYRHLWSWLLSY
jgi:hypothetical protein